MFYKFARDLTRIALSIWFRLEYLNKSSLSEGQGCIIACNHTSAVDPLVLAYGVKPAIHFMAKKELFTNPFLAFLFTKGLKGFAVDRGAGDTGALDFAANLIEDGKIMGIFPEGTRSKTGELLRAKSGMAVIACNAKADILPAAVYFPEGRGFRARAYICYGEVIPFESFGITTESPRTAELKTVTKRVMDEIASLRRKCMDRCEWDGASR